MGTCDSICQSTKQKTKNDKICTILDGDIELGIGFFCKIFSPIFNKSFTVFITRNILDTSKEYKLYFVMSKRYILLNFHNKRKYFINMEYPISIIEIKENELNFVSLLEITNNLYKNINLNQVYVIYYGYDKMHEEFYSAQITSLDDRKFELKYLSNKSEMNIAAGCPIIDSENKIIGNTVNDSYPYEGIFLYKPIEDFYINYYNKNFKVNFYVSFLNREYIVNAEDKYMFGELIVFFYFESGLDFDENISFFYNNREIPYFSSENLFNLNIKANSKIYVIKKNSDFFNENHKSPTK